MKSPFMILLVVLILLPIRSASQQKNTPQIGAEVFLESWQSAEFIDNLFKILEDHGMPVARIFLLRGDTLVNDNVFNSALRHNVKLQVTFPLSVDPTSEAELSRSSEYIRSVVTRYRDHPALETWWLLNEPQRVPSPSPLAMNNYRKWLEKKYENIGVLNKSWRTNYSSFDRIEFNDNWIRATNLSSTVEYYEWSRFSIDNLTWVLNWIADEVKKYDTRHQIHVNPAGIFSNLPVLDFPEWRSFLTSLGASIHPSWHFGILEPEEFTFGIAATCELIKGSSEPDPFWVSELQAGNNIWSGERPLGPEAVDIAQWTWTGIGCGAEKIIYWLLNNRSKGGESGEWSMLDVQGNPSDRLITASQISKTIDSEKIFFSGARAIDRNVFILLSRESMLTLARKATRDRFAGRNANAHVLSALSYYKALSELGIPAGFKYINDFDWENKTNCVAILPHTVSVPMQSVKRIEIFVNNGNKLIIDGLTGYFDEDEVNVLQTGFFFEKLCGGTIKDIRTKKDIFKIKIDNISDSLPVHLWQSEILNKTAKVISRDRDRITGVRNNYGNGEVIWIPELLGLGSWHRDNSAFGAWLQKEITPYIKNVPVVFTKKTNDITIQTLQNGTSFVTVIANGTNSSQSVNLKLNQNLKHTVIFNSSPGKYSFDPMKFNLAGRQTIVVKWESE